MKHDADERQYNLCFQSAFAQFSGLTWFEYLNKREKEIARESPPLIHCGYRTRPRYIHGIGLQIIVDADVLNRNVIESAITDFIARGEQEWISDKITYPKVSDILEFT